MPDWLAALLGSSAFVGAAALAVRETSGALARRADASVRRMNAETLRSNAESERLLAEARVRESQSRITESDAHALREAFTSARKELSDAREEIRRVIQALEEERLRAAFAEERAEQMHRDFRAFHAEVRAGRPPRHTPPSFARPDYGVTR